MRDTEEPLTTQQGSTPERDDVPDVRAPVRSLVPVTPQRPQAVGHRWLRPSAAFLAHLIATAEGAPQTRTRRRAAAADATAQYASVARNATRARARRWSM